jgi:hypothetical protein
MGQIPDPDYNPESSGCNSGMNYYYSRAERLALPNAPSPMRRKTNMLAVFIVMNILLIVFIVWGAIWNKKQASGRMEASAELAQGRYVFRLSRAISGDFLEAQLAIRLQSDDNFRLPNDCHVQFNFEGAEATNRMRVPLLQKELDLPVYVFSARAPYVQEGVAIRAFCSGVGTLPPVELLLK